MEKYNGSVVSDMSEREIWIHDSVAIEDRSFPPF